MTAPARLLDRPVPFLDLAAAQRELAPEIEAALMRTARSGRYIGGPEVAAFEADWAAHCGAAHAIGCGNGFDALVLALRACGIGPGDGVIVPAHTFVATWHAVTALGARPQPVAVDPATMVIDAEAVARAIDPATRAILPVHLYGNPAPMTDLVAIARAHGLRVIEDAAQAHGTRLDDRPIGAHGDAVAWSFYPAKTLGALGDGGAVTTNDAQIAARVRRLGNYGARAKYDAVERGVNSRLDPLQAAVLSVKLARLDEWVERRRRLAAFYDAALAETDLVLPTVPQGAAPSWHLYVVRHAAPEALAARLAEAGIETARHYPIACHRQGAHAGVALDAAAAAQAEAMAASVLSLPMGPHLNPSDAARVASALRRAA